jgi:hypothetical protein
LDKFAATRPADTQGFNISAVFELLRTQPGGWRILNNSANDDRVG